MSAKIVSALPVLDQTKFFSPLPQIPDGKVLLVFGSPMRKAEKEWVLGIIATAAIREGKWIPVDTTTFLGVIKQMDNIVVTASTQNIVNAVWEMAEKRLLEVIRFEEKDYLVPSPELSHMLRKSQLRHS